MTARKKPPGSKKAEKNWSGRVTQESNVLDLKKGVLTSNDPKNIARSLKRSAEQSRRRKPGTYRSAMSMLTFYINRGGKELPAKKKRVLQMAKDELRALFKKPSPR